MKDNLTEITRRLWQTLYIYSIHQRSMNTANSLYLYRY